MEDHEIEIYKRTKDSLLTILDLNMSPDHYLTMCRQENYLVWKVLILDEHANTVLAPLVHISDLRQHNIPLFLSLHSKREPLHSVTIIYLIQPTPENIHQIVQDCKNSLYDNFQINFLSPPSETDLNTLAQGVIEAKSLNKLHKIYEQYLNYIILEPQLFTLNGPTFEVLNRSGVSDDQIELTMEDIAKSLFCVLKNCKVWPIIKSGKGFSEIIAHKLSELCWENAEEVSSINRPLLMIVDRNIDLSIMLHHSWSYQALLYDIFSNTMNKVVVPTTPPQVYEMNKAKDKFWNDFSMTDFDQVLQNIDKQFNDWKAEYDKIGDNLVQAFENVEELTEKKASLDLHMMMATEMVKRVKERHLDMYNEFEEGLMKGNNVDIDGLLNNGEANEEVEKDRLRLMAISYLAKEKDFALKPEFFAYLRTLKPRTTAEGTMKSLAGLMGKVKDKVMGNEKMLPLTRLLHSAMDNKEKEMDYFDSKFRNGQKYKREFSEAIVFVVGGGSYAEYHNLLQYAESFQKNVIYASTSMVAPNEFLQELLNLSTSA